MQAHNERGSKTFSSEQYLSMQTTTQTMIGFCVMIFGLTSMIISPTTAASVYSSRTGYCFLPPPRSEGYCTIVIEGYYFDRRTNNCERYEVGGCRSITGQSFGSRDDCLATCVYQTRKMQDLNNST